MDRIRLHDDQQVADRDQSRHHAEEREEADQAPPRRGPVGRECECGENSDQEGKPAVVADSP
jgi:hypothetical protein